MNSIRQTSEKTLLTRILARAKRLGQSKVSAGGSLTRILRKCGKPGCRCATDTDARHEAHLLTWKEGGRTRSVYVPVDMVEEVRCWTRERKRLKLLLAEMDALAVEMIKSHARASRAGRKRTLPPQ